MNNLAITDVLSYMAKEPRNAQMEAIVKMWDENHGLIEVACGVGKTWIQVFTFVREIIKAEQEGRKFKGMWVCHRLLLTRQVKENFNNLTNNFFKNHNVKFKELNSEGDNSLRVVADDQMATGMPEHIIYFTTTASINEYVKTKSSKYNDGYTVLAQNVFSQLDLYVHDEAHKEFSTKLIDTIENAMKYKMYYFFTATPSDYLKSLTPIYTCNYAQAVNAGYIVKPRFYETKVADYANLDDVAHTNNILRVFKHTHKTRKNENANLIVFLPSVDSVAECGKLLNEVKNNPNRKAIRKVNIYEIISDKVISLNGEKYKAGLKVNGQPYNNGVAYTKAKILEIIRNDQGEKIILNAFMLTEGIDLPEINSVLIACRKSDASLYQAVSRGCRKTPGKQHFNLYAISETGIAADIQEFLTELAKLTGGEFEFGGEVSDQNDGSNNDEEPDEEDGTNATDTATPKFKDVDVIVTAIKTDFDNWIIIANDIGNLQEILKGNNTLAKLDALSEYTSKWEGKYPELIEKYMNFDKILDSLQIV